MIRRLRIKLIVVLMAILVLLLVAILAGMFFSVRLNFERRSIRAFNDQPLSESAFDRSVQLAMPIASVVLDSSGRYIVMQNQIHYLSDTELIEIATALRNEMKPFGFASAYDLRYRQHVDPDGTLTYSFSDTFIERDSLKAQILYSIIIGIGALTFFLIVSLLLSRWMVKPVERAWEKQRRFVADASHELKTPLTVILSNTDMLIDSSDETDKKCRTRLYNIKVESLRMKALTEALLNLARTDSNPESVVMENVNMTFILSSAALMFEPMIFDLGRSIDCEIEENVTVYGDKHKLRQLADILIDNAVKYGTESSPIIVRMSMVNKKEALLSVTSEGVALSAKDCTSIFERFYRMDSSRGQIKGFGLGLSIAHSIVKEHGGRIWAESDGKKQNTFFVKLSTIRVSP